MVYSSVALGKENPFVDGLLKQCEESRKNVSQLVIVLKCEIILKNITVIHVHVGKQT